jgi:UDP-GlcNAc3NAcA epimerase
MDRFHLIQIVGARPQIIKSAAIDRAVKKQFQDKIRLTTVHTGQHYDHGMSEVFYKEMSMCAPDINLKVGSGSHAQQTAAMMTNCESSFKELEPDGVLIYGDTNSTLAAAIAAYKLGIPVMHVEAGLRSHNLKMPEECNRIGADHLSTYLFCPTPAAIDCLAQEGVHGHDESPSLERPGVYMTGDVMYDNSLFYAEQESEEHEVQGIDLRAQEFILATCHRPVNTDDPSIFSGILRTLEEIGRSHHMVILPVHPRVSRHRSVLEKYIESPHIKLIEPVSFLEMIRLESRCKAVVTDSGGVQKESFFFKKPCVVMREQTEWTELVDNGNAVLCGNDPERITAGVSRMLNAECTYPPFYGSGNSAEEICELILRHH